MYCEECGTKLEDGVRFCPECGTRVEQVEEVEQVKPESTTSDNKSASKEGEIVVSGILFTNIKLLAEAMDTDAKIIEEFLNAYVKYKAEVGVCYHIVDAGNYTYLERGFLNTRVHVSLNAKSEIWDYMKILMDFHKHERKEYGTESQYLFIVGGDEVVPMPCIKHYLPEKGHDKTIDTDILYAYPYGPEMLPLLENRDLFKFDQLFYVGRLPFGDEPTIDDLLGYLELAAGNRFGIPMGKAYGQCDPNWKNVSTKIASELITGDYLPNLDGLVGPDYYYHRLILSPKVNIENVDQVFNTTASLYYFNLHGGSQMGSRGYFGAARGQKYTEPVLAPEHMQSCKSANVVVSEACYGARFIGFDKQHSMLLSSIFNNTLVFLGSSRVAWGGADNPNTTPQNAYIGNADVMAKVFIAALLEGYTTGQAIFLARSAVLEHHEPGEPLAATTVVEFNLYGDPTLFLDNSANKSIGQPKNKTATTLVEKDCDIRCEIEEIDKDNYKRREEMSILERVRNAVNANIEQMHTKIGRMLYDSFGVEPREADSILKLRYSGGKEEYAFRYKVNEDKNALIEYMVTMSPSGEIKKVYTTK